MNIKFIAMGLLTATVISTAAFADDMQQNTQGGSSPAMSNDQTKNMGAMPVAPSPGAATTQTSTMPGGGTATTMSGTTDQAPATGAPSTTGNTTQTGTY